MPSPSPNRTRRKSRTVKAAESEAAAPPPKPVIAPAHIEREATAGLERIGDILRRQRERRGDELDHIADFLCIRKSFLEAIEESDYDHLPADAYAIGFLRSYAAYLGFDGPSAVNRYRDEMAGRRRKPALAMPTPIPEGRTPSAFILIGAAIAAILVYAAWYGMSTTGRLGIRPSPAITASAGDTVPVNPPEGIALPAAPMDATVTPSATAAEPLPVVTAPPPTVVTPLTATPASTGSHLMIRAEKETWVLVADDKDKAHPVLDRVMKPGDTFPVPDRTGLKLTTGNSSGIVLVLDGKDLPKLTRNSSILHDISLDIDKLKAGKTKPAPAPTAEE